MYQDEFIQGGEIEEVERENLAAACEADEREDDEDHAMSEHDEYKTANN
jgi:hypothetical protein